MKSNLSQHQRAFFLRGAETGVINRPISYNALNQATRFTQGSKRIECVYDYRNRRVEKAVYEGDTLRTRTRFIYRGYLQIAELDANTATESHPAILRKTYLWDPNEPTATRILALTTYDATGTYEAELYYTHDAQKNTSALFGIQAGRRAMYQYSAYGSLLKIDGDLAALSPFRFSSEYHDEDLDLIYYNYRYYNPTDGRWIHRDPIEEQGGVNLYGFVNNNAGVRFDYLGQKECNEDTIFHYQNMKFEIMVITNLDNKPSLADPKSTIRDALGANLADEMANDIAKHVQLDKYLKTITESSKKFQDMLLIAESTSISGWYIKQLSILLEADYCCESCSNGEKQYKWKHAKAKAISPEVFIYILNPKDLSTRFPETLFTIMQQAGEKLLDNACTE